VPPGAGRAERKRAEPVDGALLWALTRRYLTHYVSFRKPSDADLVTAWIFHACGRKRNDTGMGPLIWNATPRLLIISRKRGSGKSTLLTLISMLTGSISGKSARITPAALAQSIAQAHETVCIDEGRVVFGAGSAHLDLQALLIDGYTPKSTYRVSKTRLSVFGPVAIATKEALITEATKAVDGDESSLGDLLDRCLKVLLTEPDFPLREVGEQAEADAALLCRALVAWTNARCDDLRQAAADIAEEDYQAAVERAERGERKKQGLRAAQIARPLRAAGRVIGPGAEADIAAALEGADEAAEIMAELRARPWAGGDGTSAGDEAPEDTGGMDPELLASLAAQLPPQAPATPAAGARVYAAARVTAPAGKPVTVLLGTGHGDMTAALAACQADAGTPLEWSPGSKPGTWTALAGQASYAVAPARKD